MDGRTLFRTFRSGGGGVIDLVRLTDVNKVYQGGITGALGVGIGFGSLASGFGSGYSRSPSRRRFR